MSKSTPSSDAAAQEKKTNAVADLERRLKMLDTAKVPAAPEAQPTPPPAYAAPPPAYAAPPPAYSAPPPAYSAPPPAYSAPPPAYSAPPPPAAPPAAPAAVGTNPLLARIMAAQQRTKAGQAPPPPAPAAPPTAAAPPPPPPPAFDAALLPPPASHAPPMDLPPPPMFDAALLPPPAAPPRTSHRILPPAASAPAFEDLMDHHHHASAPNPFYSPSAVTPMEAPNAAAAEAESAMAAILGLEGLSEAEKAEMIAEQERILSSLENQKSSRPEQRSYAAPPSYGGRNSQSAAHQMSEEEQIAMAIRASQQDVSGGGDMSAVRELQQFQSDEELAQQLQKEEYNATDDRASLGASRSTWQPAEPAPKSKAKTSSKSSSSSFFSWLGLSSAPAGSKSSTAASTESDFPTSLAHSHGGGGVSRLAPAYTGEVEDSYDIGPSSTSSTSRGTRGADTDSGGVLAVTQAGRQSGN